MNAVWDLIRAAAPWVTAGLAAVIIVIRSVTEKRKGEKRDKNYGMEGMSLGMCFGMLIGTALGNDAGIGIFLGMLAGLAIGSCMHRDREERRS